MNGFEEMMETLDTMVDDSLVESFEIADDKRAEWAIKKIAEADAENDRLIELAKAEIDELKATVERLTEKKEADTSYLREHLRRYFATVEHKETKTQSSYKLLSGSLVMKKAEAKLTHTDDAALISYLENSGLTEFVKVTKAPDWLNLKKRLAIADDTVIDSQTGEIVEGVSIEHIPESFSVKTERRA